MISRILTVIHKGFGVMKSNTRLLLVAALVFVFPLIFVWITQSFFSTAYDNINTAEKHKVSVLHDTIGVLVSDESDNSELISGLIAKLTSSNSEITKIRVVEKQENNFVIIGSNVPELLGLPETQDDLYRRLPLTGLDDSFIFESIIDGSRTWQTLSAVDTATGPKYIFAEYKFTLTDSVMSARRQQSYFGLTGIFLFLILLAFWINKQVEWHKKHDVLVLQLKERDLFSNMIAHEFRSPLTAIKGYASFLNESKNLSKDEVRFAGNIRSSAERLVVLVSDFLEVARLQAGKMKIDVAEVDIRDVLTSVTEDLQSMAKDKGLKLVFTKNNEPVLMQTDAARMTQVITNIVSNAVKYTKTGEVELECTKIVGEVTVIIKDTGMGISAADQKKLFTPFSRVGGVDQTSTTGTGLGMWITQQLVVLLDGKIGVESIKGVGTHIVISFRI